MIGHSGVIRGSFGSLPNPGRAAAAARHRGRTRVIPILVGPFPPDRNAKETSGREMRGETAC